jgi:mercuric ion binding protein
MNKVLLTLLILAAVFVPLSKAAAGIKSVTVLVDGLACPFCAYGVEKKLKRVEGVESMDIRMNEGTVTLKAKEGLSIDISQVPQAIRDSGFSLREMRVAVTGIVNKEGDAMLFQYAPGEEISLKDLKPALREKLTEYSESGETVSLEGTGASPFHAE